jgi:hypothetical protein
MPASHSKIVGKKGPRKSGELARTNQARSFLTGATEIAIKEVVSILEQSAEQVLPCLQALRENFFMPKKEVCLQDKWADTYMRIDQVPKYWLQQWLLAEFPNVFTEKMLQVIDKKSKSGIRELIEYVTGVRIHAKLPRACLSKQVLSLALRQMHKQLDVKISQEWLAILLDTISGDLRWSLPGAGALKYVVDATDYVTHVEHCGGLRAAVPQEIRVMVDWAISSNFSHTDAETKHGLLNCKWVALCEEFKPIREQCHIDMFKNISEKIQTDLGKKEEVLKEGKIMVTPETASRKRKGPPTMPPATKMMALADGVAEEQQAQQQETQQVQQQEGVPVASAPAFSSAAAAATPQDP